MPTHCLSGRNLLQCGIQDGFRQQGGGLVLPARTQSAVYVSRIYDSGQEGTEWNHIRLDIGKDAVLEVYVWLFDKRGSEEEEALREDVTAWFRRRKDKAQYQSNYRNMLLYGEGCGRYARIAVKVLQSKGKDTLFKGYDLSFPKESFTEYLPAIYRNHLPLERFLAVHQNIYLSLEEEIDTLAEKLDPRFCAKDYGVMLAKWMGWGELAEQLEEDILKELLGRGISLAGKKGTCSYYVELTGLLTGEDVSILEELDRGRAVVLIWDQPEEGREKYLEWLKRNVPIGIDIDFVILNQTGRLDGQFFLDKTSRLSQYESRLPAEGCPIECLRLL